MDRFDVCPGNGETVVYSVGTLYGEWIDGTPFEGNRYVDRFVVQNGQIVKMDVWNDSADGFWFSAGLRRSRTRHCRAKDGAHPARLTQQSIDFSLVARLDARHTPGQ